MDTETGVPTCYRHPDRHTRLACSACGRPACVDCVRAASVGQKCVECALPEGRGRVLDAEDVQQETVRRSQAQILREAPATVVIIAAAVLVALLQYTVPAVWNDLAQRGVHSNALIARGQWWRLVTAAFFHADTFHLLFNMWALWVFGPQIERQVGTVPFLGLYFGAAVAGGAALFVLTPDATALGASGAIFGLFGAWIAAAVRSRGTPGGRASLRQLGILLGINLALPLFIPNIAWQAHLGGLAAGVVIAMGWAAVKQGAREGLLARSAISWAVLLLGLAVVAVG